MGDLAPSTRQGSMLSGYYFQGRGNSTQGDPAKPHGPGSADRSSKERGPRPGLAE
jgi:hypothetical protein